ncbi:hypothetical protein Tco_0024515 [Tanacetum coccineum]
MYILLSSLLILVLVEYLAERMIYGVTLQRNSVMRRSYANQVGRLFVKGTGTPTEILAKLNELVGFAPDEDIELFEIKFEPNVMCEHVDKKLTFRASQVKLNSSRSFKSTASMTARASTDNLRSCIWVL